MSWSEWGAAIIFPGYRKMSALIRITVICLFVGGCGLVAQAERNKQILELTELSNKKTAACQSEPFTTHVNLAICLNRAKEVLIPIAPHPDLVTLLASQRIEIAERVDRREITPAEGDVQFNLARTNAIAESNRRSLAQRSVSAQEQAATRTPVCTFYRGVPICF